MIKHMYIIHFLNRLTRLKKKNDFAILTFFLEMEIHACMKLNMVENKQN